jgi:hypothetical protein
MQQSPYTTESLPFAAAESPTLCLDARRVPYVSILGRQADGSETLLFYKLRPDTGVPTEWTYDRLDGTRCFAYGYAYTGAPYAVLPTAGTAGTFVGGNCPLSLLDETLVAATTILDADNGTTALRLTGFAQPLIFDYITAFQYIVDNKTLCSCNGGCDC